MGRYVMLTHSMTMLAVGAAAALPCLVPAQFSGEVRVDVMLVDSQGEMGAAAEAAAWYEGVWRRIVT